MARSINYFIQELNKWGNVVKFSHTIFALPFALSMMAIVSKRVPVNISQILLLLVCLTTARTGAMAFNRILDRHIDGRNPRTQNRDLPAGRVTLVSAWTLLICAYGLFILAAAMLGVHTLVLSPLVLFILSFYSFTKRFTSYSHVVLGLCLAMAPGGVWYALVGTIEMTPVWLMLGIVFWVAGFDIIYSCQDVHFDRSNGLFSVPAKVGISRALNFSRFLHLVAMIFLFKFGTVVGAGPIYKGALLIFGVIVFSQHLIVNAKDLSRVNEAFFVRNGIASVLLFLGTAGDALLA